METMTSPPRSEEIEQLLVSGRYYQELYETLDLIRDAGPAYFSPSWDAWIVAGYEECKELLRDSDRFSNAKRMTRFVDSLPEDLQVIGRLYHGDMLHSDPPDHTRLRKLVGNTFTPRMLTSLGPDIERLTVELLDEVPRGEPVDLKDTFAQILPVYVIAQMLGVPVEHRDTFLRWGFDMIEFMATMPPEREPTERAITSVQELYAYFEEVIEDRRNNPRDDLVSRLALAKEDDDRLTAEEVLMTCRTVLVAGHETTTNLIANGIMLLAQHPDQYQMLREDPELVPSAVEEMLRFEASGQRILRRVIDDTDFFGCPMKKDQFAVAILGGANRDPRAFEDPNRFDITRDPNYHLTFGIGRHHCIGAPLARLEGKIVFTEMVKRYESIELATDQLVWHRNTMVRSLESLPVVVR